MRWYSTWGVLRLSQAENSSQKRIPPFEKIFFAELIGGQNRKKLEVR